LCIALRQWQLLPPLWGFGSAFLLVAIANQAIYPAAQEWILSQAGDDVAVVILSYSQMLIGVAVIMAAFGFSWAAENGRAIWPLVMMLFITAVALLAATTQVPGAAARQSGVSPH